MKLKKVTVQTSKEIAKLEAEVYPPAFRLGEKAIRENLSDMEANNCNFSWSTLDKAGNINAYLIAYLDTSHSNKNELVAYIDDIVVKPSAKKSSVYFLLKAMIKDFTDRGLKIAIEGVSRSDAHKMWKKHGQSRAIGKLGYHMVDSYTYWDEDSCSELHWERFEPVEKNLLKSEN